MKETSLILAISALFMAPAVPAIEYGYKVSADAKVFTVTCDLPLMATGNYWCSYDSVQG
ncbi:MAG: hypothetical protein RDV48_06840 [Candidatus Eremiobacteraeota bacterium]|nr:hypothetical protein [Candidatus Eremiobacteraeota bacterium]